MDSRANLSIQYVAAISLAAFLLAGCSSGPSSAGPPNIGGGDLTGVKWVLDKASMHTLIHDRAPASARIDLTFDGSHASGYGACNSYSGAYQADDVEGSIAFSGLGISTHATCDANLMQLETAYLEALSNFTSYVVGDALGERFVLVLLGGNTSVTFSPRT